MRYLFTAEPCGDTDPTRGARLLCGSEALGRLAPDEARALVADLLAAADGGQVRYLTAGDIADHFGVSPYLVHQWRHRYGPGRPAEEIVKAPVCPQPDPVRVGVKRQIDVWAEWRLPEWDAWKASLPGHGAGGGRPPKGGRPAAEERR